jgi:4-amino-4-deoxy-L-arabinose transferase-like glycosyltransferase
MGLVGPDEPRYAWIGRAMASSGDWVTPRLYGQPWFEKPVLYYWLSAIGFMLHLPAEWATRLPSALAALAAAIAIGWLSWKEYGSGADFSGSPTLLAPLIFATSVAAIGFARAATPDMLFSAFITFAMVSAASVMRRSGALRPNPFPSARSLRGDAVQLLFFGAWLGLAVLAKGPAGLILAGGAVGMWALATGSWRAAVRLAHPLAIVAFCIVGLPWYVLCAIRNPDFIHVFIFQQNFERYVTPVFQHKQPFWFFGYMTPLGLLPWTILLVPVAQEGVRLWRENSWRDSPSFFVACWAIFPMLFFTFSKSKLPGYILPAIPPLALLLAVAWSRPTPGRSKSHRWIGVTLGLTWVVMGLLARMLIRRLPPGAWNVLGHMLSVCAVIGVGGGIAIAGMGFLRKRWIVLTSALLVALIVEIAGARILPIFDPYISARPHAQILLNLHRPEPLFAFHLKRAWSYNLAFYLDRNELPDWSPSDPEAALVLTTPAGMEEIRRLGRFNQELDQSHQGILYILVLPSSAERR